jgi:hypothetical protein
MIPTKDCFRLNAADHPIADEWLLPGKADSRNFRCAPSEPRDLTQSAWSPVDSRYEKAHLQELSTRWETTVESSARLVHREPWNKSKIVGQNAPFKLKDI